MENEDPSAARDAFTIMGGATDVTVNDMDAVENRIVAGNAWDTPHDDSVTLDISGGESVSVKLREVNGALPPYTVIEAGYSPNLMETGNETRYEPLINASRTAE